MADCVACGYPAIQVARGQRVGLKIKNDPKVQEVLKKHRIELREDDDANVGCYVCPDCGHCTWLEE